MKRIAEVVGKILGIGLLVVAGALYVKGCVGTGASFVDAKYYKRQGPGGSEVYLALLPPRSVVLVKKYGEAEDAAMYEMYGAEMTSIIGDLYNTGTTPLGLRYYSGAKKVLDVGLTIVNKQSYKCSQSSYDDVGSSYSTIMVIRDNAITSDGDEYGLAHETHDIYLLQKWAARLSK